MTEASKDTGAEELVGLGVGSPIISDEFEFAGLSHNGSEHKQRKTGLGGPVFQVMTQGEDQLESSRYDGMDSQSFRCILVPEDPDISWGRHHSRP
jgi:hypothetical protein